MPQSSRLVQTFSDKHREMTLKFLLFVLVFPTLLCAQDNFRPIGEYGELLVARFGSAPFPHPQRSEGHTYDGKLYSYEEHYSDSSVAMFIPHGFRRTDKVDLVFHFHGWFNNIDTTFKRYELARQFAESGKNAILIVPEGPRNAPDSFGGKLEDAGGFEHLVREIIYYLHSRNKIKTQQIGRIILSGHSGGYHVISFILTRGGLTEHIKEVYLFDALYGQTEKFVHWIDAFKGKMITMYTDSGGTKDETKSLVADLDGWSIAHFDSEDDDVSLTNLTKSRLVFLHTNLQHDQVLQVRSALRKFLSASVLSNR
jgi:hypothetical protein